jgi:hypothetical protein
MPTPTESVVFDVHDAKVWPLTSDASDSPTYGAPVDVPGIADVSMDPNLQTSELKGDATIIAKKGRLDKFNMSSTYGKLSMNVMEAILGGETTEASDIQEYRYKGGTSLPYFAYGVNLLDVEPGLGSIQVIVFKAQITGGTLLSQSSDNFGQPTFDVEGISLNCPEPSEWYGVMMAMRFFPTVVQLPTDPSEWTAAGGAVVPATGATAGTPGTWQPGGSTPPPDAAGATAVTNVTPATGWTTGQYMQGSTAGTPGEMYWDDDSWVAGRHP